MPGRIYSIQLRALQLPGPITDPNFCHVLNGDAALDSSAAVEREGPMSAALAPRPDPMQNHGKLIVRPPIRSMPAPLVVQPYLAVVLPPPRSSTFCACQNTPPGIFGVANGSRASSLTRMK